MINTAYINQFYFKILSFKESYSAALIFGARKLIMYDLNTPNYICLYLVLLKTKVLLVKWRKLLASLYY